MESDSSSSSSSPSPSSSPSSPSPSSPVRHPKRKFNFEMAKTELPEIFLDQIQSEDLLEDLPKAKRRLGMQYMIAMAEAAFEKVKDYSDVEEEEEEIESEVVRN